MRFTGSMAIAAVLLSACSTRPREFRAQLEAPPPDAQTFERDMRRCQIMVRRGVKKDFTGTAAQAMLGTGGGIGAGALAGGLGTTLSSSVGIGASAMFVVGPLVGFGVSRAIRSGREKKYKEALGSCMAEYGYGVADWQKQKRLTKAEIAAALNPDEQGAPSKADPVKAQ